MKKKDRLNSLFDFEKTGTLLVDYMAARQVRDETMEYLGVGTERAMLDRLGVDFYYLSFRDISQNECCLPFYKGPSLMLDESFRTCPFGIRWNRKVGDDKFGVDEAIEGPFATNKITEKDILNYPWPEAEWFDFSGLSEECGRFSDKIIIGGLWSGIHGDSNRMMGYENFLLNIAMNRPLVKTLVDRMTRFYLEANRRYFEAVKGKMDIFFMGNDFGTQSGLLMSEEDWKDLYYHNYKKLIDLAHDYGFKVMVHSCGAIESLLPHFIRLGVDIIDPVQITADGMDPEVLSGKYGNSIVFHGAIDTQNILPFGTQANVREHCREIIGKLNTSGNLIVAPSNNFMSGTPPANIKEVYKVVKDYNNL
ncbi:MAG: uroporphyrinogen decarboxylase family protein [Bacteroidota bacterium]